MLTSIETEGVREILKFVNADDVLAVAQTTTNHLIAFVTLNEAIEAILKYTEKPSDFLQRKKVTKAIIFQYLRKAGEVVSVNADKTKLIKYCLRFWQSSDSLESSCHLDEESRSFQEDMMVESLEISEENYLATQGSMQQMSTHFVTWFFSSLHAVQNFGPQHFWPDCKLFVISKNPPCNDDHRGVFGAENVAKFLMEYITHDQLYFAPNISHEAIKYDQEQHGLVRISASGVVHKLRNCVGLFDFTFGLIMDPLFNHNWKIKAVYLQFRLTNAKLGIQNGSLSHSYMAVTT